MMRWVVAFFAIVSLGCWRSYGLRGDVSFELDMEITETMEVIPDQLQEETVWPEEDDDGDGSEFVEYDSLPPCDPPSVSHHYWEGCGDRVVQGGEECDYGDTLDGDGCDWNCRWGDWEGGGAEPSPLPLPRYGIAGDFHKVADFAFGGPGGEPYSTIFWWTGSEFRLLYQSFEWVEGPLDREILRLISFGRNASSTQVLFERTYVGESDLDEYRNAYFSRFDSGIEIYIVHKVPTGEDRRTTGEISYMAIDQDGNLLLDERPLFRGMSGFYGRIISYQDETYISIDLGEAVVVERSYPQVGLCHLSIMNPISDGVGIAWERETVYSIEGNETCTILEKGRDISDAEKLQLAVPLSTGLAADLEFRPICIPASTYYHCGDLASSEDGFQVFTVCQKYSPGDELYPFIPYYTHVNSAAGVSSPSTEILPEGFLDQFFLDSCPFHPTPDYFRVQAQLFAEKGEDTLGVIFVPGILCEDRIWAPLFQTLDLDGRPVGEPSDQARNFPIELQSVFPVILDLVWDGEGYAVAALAQDGIYFWRYLPE